MSPEDVQRVERDGERGRGEGREEERKGEGRFTRSQGSPDLRVLFL